MSILFDRIIAELRTQLGGPFESWVSWRQAKATDGAILSNRDFLVEIKEYAPGHVTSCDMSRGALAVDLPGASIGAQLAGDSVYVPGLLSIDAFSACLNRVASGLMRFGDPPAGSMVKRLHITLHVGDSLVLAVGARERVVGAVAEVVGGEQRYWPEDCDVESRRKWELGGRPRWIDDLLLDGELVFSEPIPSEEVCRRLRALVVIEPDALRSASAFCSGDRISWCKDAGVALVSMYSRSA